MRGLTPYAPYAMKTKKYLRFELAIAFLSGSLLFVFLFFKEAAVRCGKVRVPEGIVIEEPVFFRELVENFFRCDFNTQAFVLGTVFILSTLFALRKRGQ